MPIVVPVFGAGIDFFQYSTIVVWLIFATINTVVAVILKKTLPVVILDFPYPSSCLVSQSAGGQPQKLLTVYMYLFIYVVTLTDHNKISGELTVIFTF